MHWADKYAEKLLVRGRKHVIETGTSISGIPHVGNASDIIRGDAIRKALLDKGVKADFIWVADDSDPFRKVPAGMDSLKHYLGFPVFDIPDHEGCHKNFVEHFVEPFLSDLKEFGVEPKAYSGTELYRSGALYDEIKAALEKSREIVEIMNEFRTDPLPKDFIPWNPICESCGKISTTRTLGWEKDKVKYTCEDVSVTGGEVKGCKHEGEGNIKKGVGKLPWRVEWAARWKHFRVTCEPFGKEHATAGGSYWTSKVISEKILEWRAPVPVTYEFFTLNGEKISSSTGNVITLRDWLKIAEPEVLKYFMYKRLKKQRDINLRMISNLTDEYDGAERVNFDLEKGSEEIKRMYELSQIKKPELLQAPFTLCAVLAQIIPKLNVKKISEKLKALGYEEFNEERLKKRLETAKNWVESYGPDYLKFELIGDAIEVKDKLNKKQIKGLGILANELGKKWTPEKLHARIYEIARTVELEPSELFKAIYLPLIGKERGPKAASFILSLDKDFVQKRFEEF